MLISEFLADPKAVADSAGEWFELANAGSTPVNLRGWAIVDGGGDRYAIADDLMVDPGGYIVFVANGDRDLMVDSSLSADMARRLPNAQLTIYPDSGHGGVFQHHRAFVPAVLDFLAD